MIKKSTVYSSGDEKPHLPWLWRRRSYFFLLCLCIFATLNVQYVHSQKIEKRPGVPEICPAKFEDQFSRAHIPKDLLSSFRSSLAQEATAEFEVTFGPGAQANPEARAAFEFALDIWATEIVSSVPIKVFAEFTDLGPGILASAGPAYNVRNFPGAPEPDIFYPAALANALAGEVLFPDEDFDLVVNLGNGIPWYFGLDGNTPAGLFDFVTVALHEAGHGLGFTTIRGFSAGVGSLRSNGSPAIFSVFMVEGDGTPLLDLPDPSSELGDAFTGGDLFMDGDFARAALGGDRPELYAPSTFAGGSSLAHWDEAAFPSGDVNALMTPFVGSAESNFDIGDITRGLFRDMGWVLNDQEATPLVASPAALNLELFVGDTLTQFIRVSSISDTIVNASVSANPGNSTIASLSPTELSLASRETDSIRVILSAINLARGSYNDTIFIEAVGEFQPLIIPVSVRVLDGTEVPVIEVSPDAIDETLQQFQVQTLPLTIANTGEADLEFRITVDDDSLMDFSSRVRASDLALAEQGFTTRQYPRNQESSHMGTLVRGDFDAYNQMVTSLYATDFEGFTPGDIDFQMGWRSQFANNWVISSANPAGGSLHTRGVSDGLGSTRDGNILALSPSITPLDAPFMVMSVDVNLTGSGVTWEIITQSNTAGQVNTRLRFNPEGTIDVLVNPGGYVPVNATIPTGYFNVKIVVDKDDATFSIYFDDELIFSGQGFASTIEQAVFLSLMEVAGPTFDADNLEITDGDPNAFFVSVNPFSGVVPFGSSETVNVKLDARTLDPGSYSAGLTINSNDSVNSPLNIPVNLTVIQPPTISVAPDSITASVDVQVDIPPVRTGTITISNSGGDVLEFETSLEEVNFEPNLLTTSIPIASLDMANYGLGNMSTPEEKLAGSIKKFENLVKKEQVLEAQIANATFIDSIFYDTGLPFPGSFAGLETAPYTSAIKFDAEDDFILTAVRNGYNTQAVADPVIILEVYRGGDTPNDGELLLQQAVTQASEEGIVVAEILERSLSFDAGESFWIVHKYPDGIEFPQGIDPNATQRPNTYFFSGDGGTTYNPSNFVFFVRALSGEQDYITLEPSAGSVAPGGSVDVLVTFNGEGLSNGTYLRDILVASNDPVTPVANVVTNFTVSGQFPAIALSDEFILFNSVFLGAEAQRSFTITNEGLAALNVSSISSDNPDFTVNISNATVGAGESVEVAVTFSPSALGSINGIISIESDAPGMSSLEVVVNGVGTEPPLTRFSPESVEETTDAGTVLESSISLVNDGNSPLIFSFPDLAVAAALAKPGVQLNNTEKIDFGGLEMSLEKGADDNRVGAPVLYSLGTDNGFGYTWIDSDEPGGPVYNFVDITASGNEITPMLGADGTMEVSMTFPFEFYGQTYLDLFINANGYVSFDPIGGGSWINTQIPDDGSINNLIAGFWDDIEPQNFNGAVHYQDFGDRFIIQWTDAARIFGNASQTFTFQIVLYGNGDIDVFYEDVDTAITTSGTVGIENADGTDGAQVAFNTEYIKNGLALRFVKPAFSITPFISQATPMSGVVPAGGQRDISVSLDATELNDGVYFDELTVSSNAPVDTSSSALFQLTVIGFPEIEVTPDSLDFGPLFVSLSSSASVLIENVGSKVLEISSISNANADFVIDTVAPATLFPDQSLLVGVRFTPTSFGLIEDLVTIVSNDAFGNETTQVYLSGIGVDPPVISVSPDSIGVVINEGDSAVEVVSITNEGNFPLSYALSPPSFAQAGENVEALQYPVLDLPKIRSKEALDNRVGAAFLNASGGPGTFGYTWVDNNSGGPAYDFIDISETGQVANVGNDGDESVPLPFTFNFFGLEQDSVTIGANGFLTFAELVGTNFVNDPIPNTDNPNFLIAGMWDDLEPDDGGGVFYQGTEDYFIVQYENVPGFGFPPFLPIPDPVTFQVILFPNGSIKVQYANVNSTIRTSSTVGLEGPMGMEGLQVIFNTSFLTDELAITFTPPILGTVAPGETAEVPVTIFTEGLESGGVAAGDIRISSNDPVTPEVNVPVTVEVLDLPGILGFTLINADLNEEIGPLVEGDVIDLDNYPVNSFSVVATPDSEVVRSVVFDFNEVTRFQVENSPPYALDGDAAGGTRFNPIEFPIGMNTVTATPYTRGSGNGEPGIGLTVNFEVIGTTVIDACYGGEVLSYLPGDRKNGLALPSSRSDATRALGPPQENDSYNFVALGFGGSIEIAMECEVMDRPGNDVLVIETSFRDTDQPCESYPERAQVEASEDGVNWVLVASEICKDGAVDIANGGLASARYFRITDISDPNDFRGVNADGYDLDAIVRINTVLDTASQVEMVEALTDKVNVVANEEDVEIRVFPNPVDDLVNFSFKGEDSRITTIIYDMRGEIIHRSNLQISNGEESGMIRMGQYRSGLYQMQVINESGGIISQFKFFKR